MNFKHEIVKIKEVVKAPKLERDMSMWKYEDLKFFAEMRRSRRYQGSDSYFRIDEKNNIVFTEEQEKRYVEICESYDL